MTFNKKLLSSVLLVGLFMVGCGSKQEDVATYKNKDKVAKVDKKVDTIKTKKADTNKVVEPKKSTVSKAEVSVIDKFPNLNKVSSVVDGKKVTLVSIHFGFDKYKLSDKMLEVNSINAKTINEVTSTNSNVKIKLEGNCDEWGTDEYNYALGLKRTKSVKKALINEGISADRIVVVSYGESNPICKEQTKACWKKNRRVDHKILP